MTLEALGRQYAAEADTLADLIVLCNSRRKTALREGNSREAKRLKRLAEHHTQQQEDLQQISAWLLHYYDSSKGIWRDYATPTTTGGMWVHVA